MSRLSRSLKHSVRPLAWALALLPGLLALPFLWPDDPGRVTLWLNALGRLTGITGLSFLLVAAALCCRVPGFDRPFGGLTKLWRLHHIFGAVAFLLLLMHPLLLAFAMLEVSVQTAVDSLFSTRTPVLWGWGALLTLMVFLSSSFGFWGEPEYQRWKWLHRLSGVAVVLALVHTFWLSRTLPETWSMAVWSLYALLAVAALCYRWGYVRWRGRQPYRVTEVAHPALDVVELTLLPEGKPMSYQAGQFVYLTPVCESLPAGHCEEHPYTLSSAPTEPATKLAIKSLGDASHALQALPEGSRVYLEGPYGDFLPDNDTGPALWIAGGIGVTPFLSRVRQAVAAGESLQVVLIECVQDETRLLFGDELRSAFERWPESRFQPHLFYQEGPLSAAFLATHCPDLASRTIYICGPEPLIRLARSALLLNGVSDERIVTEEFTLF